MTRTRFAYLVLSAGLLVAITMGVRQSFGLFLEPISSSLSLDRQTFGLAIAIQNLVLGLALPAAGMAADHFGASRILAVCTLAYVAGLLFTALSPDAVSLQLGLGLLVGLGLSGTTWVVVLGAVARLVPRERTSLALGIVTAGGSVGMFALVPVVERLLANYGWTTALLVLAGATLLLLPVAMVLRGPAHSGHGVELDAPASMRAALRAAASHRGYWLLNGGFFVCGFHVAFIATHLPAYLTDKGISSDVAGLSLALIGFFNILGSYFCGLMGGRHSRKHLLALLYIMRSVIITVFLLVPLSTQSALLFSAAIGFLWLGTVPLTSGIVTQIFGMRYMSTLFGVVFLSHQLGAFTGAWLGGYVYDLTGSYNVVWLISIGLGLLAALLHWPINDAPLSRRSAREPVAEAG